MPITWDIDETAGLVTVRVVGPLTLDDARQALTELYAQPSYRPPIVDLWDLRSARLDPSPGDVEAFVRFIQGSRGDRGTDQTALVVASMADFGISRMYQAHAEACLSLSIRAFTQLDEAYAWLDRAMPTTGLQA
ncbi:MAG TPA: STAS/SEC14 domain-containing protein [Enhygromyxa sp.]|nr:STAS/SEC14 domain-containing protein [Enhygromyxa sp.]